MTAVDKNHNKWHLLIIYDFMTKVTFSNTVYLYITLYNIDTSMVIVTGL